MRMVMVEGCFPSSFRPASGAFATPASGFAPCEVDASGFGAVADACFSGRCVGAPSVKGAPSVRDSTFFSPLLSPMSLTCP